ncbi:MAG: hypothetical protein ACXAC8_18505 [Candidatus Hodarchaeales archaeon]|jgi:sugar-specific transcriptional regulator TrmB
MVGINLNSDELEIIFDILGLNEDQSSVYSALVSIGTLTLGQISQVTGLNYIEVRNAMDVLIGGEYADWTPGKINRYFAREPFLKTFLLTYDLHTLQSIRDTTKKIAAKIEQDIQTQIQPLIDRVAAEDSQILQDIQDLIKKNLEGQQRQIDNEISALTFSISEMKKKLDIIYQLSRKIKAATVTDVSVLTTDLIYGETTFVLILKDMTSRAKASLTILMPHPEIQTLIGASKLSLPIRTRTLIVGDFSKVPKNMLKKILASKIRLKQKTVEYWGCVRDNEEVLIGPLPHQSLEERSDDGLIGIISTNPTMIHFIKQLIGSYTTRGRDLVID